MWKPCASGVRRSPRENGGDAVRVQLPDGRELLLVRRAKRLVRSNRHEIAL